MPAKHLYKRKKIGRTSLKWNRFTLLKDFVKQKEKTSQRLENVCETYIQQKVYS